MVQNHGYFYFVPFPKLKLPNRSEDVTLKNFESFEYTEQNKSSGMVTFSKQATKERKWALDCTFPD